MTRKEYLLKVLEFIEKDWPVATGLKVLIEQDMLEDKTLDIIQGVLDTAIKKTKDQKEKNKLMKIKDHLTNLQEKEEQERRLEEEDLALLESELDDL